MMKKLLIVIGVILVIGVIGIAVGGGSDSSSGTNSDTKNTSGSESNAKETIEYTDVSVAQLEEDLKANALTASDAYKDGYWRVSGNLSTVDASGDYFTLENGSDDYSFISVMFYIKDDEQLEKVRSLTSEQEVTVKAQCTDVGEVLGYSFDIIEIE